MRTYPNDGEKVWIEHPEGRHFRVTFDASAKCFVGADGARIAADDVANWSREEREDYDISDDPKQMLGGSLTRDQ
jgi:hypothetical protein